MKTINKNTPRDAKGRFVKKNNTLPEASMKRFLDEIRAEIENETSKENSKITITNKEENKNMNNKKKVFTMEDLVEAVMLATQGTTVVNNTVITPETPKGNGWAVNSKFYGKEINGVIYNPYLFSRFVPARYLRMMQGTANDWNQYNVSKVIRKSYDETYAIEVVKKEVNKLAMLQKRDKVAFEDRKWLYEINLVKRIIKEYILECTKYIDEAPIKRQNKVNYKSIKGRGYVPCGEMVEKIVKHKIVTVLEESAELVTLKKELNDFANDIQSCNTYAEMSNLLANFKIIKLKSEPTNSFIEAYKRRGAYETLKYLVAFGDCSFKGHTKGVDSLNAVMNYVRNKEAYQLHAALKECIKDNNFDIFNPIFNER